MKLLNCLSCFKRPHRYTPAPQRPLSRRSEHELAEPSSPPSPGTSRHLLDITPIQVQRAPSQDESPSSAPVFIDAGASAQSRAGLDQYLAASRVKGPETIRSWSLRVERRSSDAHSPSPSPPPIRDLSHGDRPRRVSVVRTGSPLNETKKPRPPQTFDKPVRSKKLPKNHLLKFALSQSTQARIRAGNRSEYSEESKKSDALFDIYDQTDWTKKSEFVNGIQEFNKVLSSPEDTVEDRLIAASFMDQLLGFVRDEKGKIHRFDASDSDDVLSLIDLADIVIGSQDFIESFGYDRMVPSWNKTCAWFRVIVDKELDI